MFCQEQLRVASVQGFISNIKFFSNDFLRMGNASVVHSEVAVSLKHLCLCFVMKRVFKTMKNNLSRVKNFGVIKADPEFLQKYFNVMGVLHPVGSIFDQCVSSDIFWQMLCFGCGKSSPGSPKKFSLEDEIPVTQGFVRAEIQRVREEMIGNSLRMNAKLRRRVAVLEHMLFNVLQPLRQQSTDDKIKKSDASNFFDMAEKGKIEHTGTALAVTKRGKAGIHSIGSHGNISTLEVYGEFQRLKTSFDVHISSMWSGKGVDFAHPVATPAVAAVGGSTPASAALANTKTSVLVDVGKKRHSLRSNTTASSSKPRPTKKAKVQNLKKPSMNLPDST